MSLFKNFRLPVFFIGLIFSGVALGGELQGPKLGVPVEAGALSGWDISIGPEGRGLPNGEGDSRLGFTVFTERCLRCHGQRGAGGLGLADPLVGGIGSLATNEPLKTVGSYWPYATTIFDYIRRAMPYDAPASLTNSEVYAVTAYILAQNGIIGEVDAMNAVTLPMVRMPNRDGFVMFWPEEDRK